MSRVRYSTTIDEDLLSKAKDTAESLELGGANDIIEDALRIYFANLMVEVWEKRLSGGWVTKLVVRPGSKVTFESIRSRKVLKYNPGFHTQEVLESKGWKRSWKMRGNGG